MAAALQVDSLLQVFITHWSGRDYIPWRNVEYLSKTISERSIRKIRFWLGNFGKSLKYQRFSTNWILLESESEVAQLCPTLCSPMDCSLRGSSIHGIFQARVLEWVAISFSRGSSQPRDWTLVSRIAGRLFTLSATREELHWLYSRILLESRGKLGCIKKERLSCPL